MPRGALALVGSGEYTPAMEATDRMLLNSLAVKQPRVVVIPTASGLEHGQPARWNRMGGRHFEDLGRMSPRLI
jgi:peptidase E